MTGISLRYVPERLDFCGTCSRVYESQQTCLGTIPHRGVWCVVLEGVGMQTCSIVTFGRVLRSWWRGDLTFCFPAPGKARMYEEQRAILRRPFTPLIDQNTHSIQAKANTPKDISHLVYTSFGSVPCEAGVGKKEENQEDHGVLFERNNWQ